MKKNLILVAILILIAGLVIFQKKRKENLDLAEKNFILHFEEKDAVGLRLKFNGNDTVLSKSNGVWYITAPERAKADPDEAVANIKNFATANYLTIVSKNSENLEKWGLVNPTNFYEIVIKDKKGNEVRKRLLQGKRNEVPKSYYAKFEDESTIYSLDFWVIESLKKPVSQLRVRKFIQIEPEEIREVSYGDINISKQNLLYNVKGKGFSFNTNSSHAQNVDQIYQALSFMKAQAVFTEPDEIAKRASHKLFDIRFTGMRMSGGSNENVASKKREPVSFQFELHLVKEVPYLKHVEKNVLYQLSEKFDSIFQTNKDYFDKSVTNLPAADESAMGQYGM